MEVLVTECKHIAYWTISGSLLCATTRKKPTPRPIPAALVPQSISIMSLCSFAGNWCSWCGITRQLVCGGRVDRVTVDIGFIIAKSSH